LSEGRGRLQSGVNPDFRNESFERVARGCERL
jgi:hypothetical protein